jgi:hypothetical protein
VRGVLHFVQHDPTNKSRSRGKDEGRSKGHGARPGPAFATSHIRQRRADVGHPRIYAVTEQHLDDCDNRIDGSGCGIYDFSMDEKRRRGIYLVANRFSSEHCHNLIYSIRECGCPLPIRILPYGGEPLRLQDGFADVALARPEDFPVEGREFVAELRRRMPQCSPGLLQRFLCWFGEFDEFLYSDNDIVALMNWEEMFGLLGEHGAGEYDLVHADREFITRGIFNLWQPERFEELMGPGALDKALTAGHFLCRRSPRQVADLLAGVSWMEAHPEVPKWHDQALMHVTVALSGWRVLNLCKPPHNWGCSWAGTYKNTFDVLRTVSAAGQRISHLHYSGGTPTGTAPVEELLHANLPAGERNRQLLGALLREASGVGPARRLLRRVRNKVKRMSRGED